MSFAAVHRPTDRQTVAGNRHRLCVRECSLNFGSNRSGSDREDGSRAALAGREELGKASKGDKFICRQLDGHSSLQLLLSLSLFFSAPVWQVERHSSTLLPSTLWREALARSTLRHHSLPATLFHTASLHIVCFVYLSDNVILPAYFHVMVQ